MQTGHCHGHAKGYSFTRTHKFQVRFRKNDYATLRIFLNVPKSVFMITCFRFIVAKIVVVVVGVAFIVFVPKFIYFSTCFCFRSLGLFIAFSSGAASACCFTIALWSFTIGIIYYYEFMTSQYLCGFCTSYTQYFHLVSGFEKKKTLSQRKREGQSPGNKCFKLSVMIQLRSTEQKYMYMHFKDQFCSREIFCY